MCDCFRVVVLCIYVFVLLVVIAIGVRGIYHQLKPREKKGVVLSDVTGQAHWIGESEVIKLPVYIGTIDHWMYKPGKRLAYLIPDPDALEPRFGMHRAAWLSGDCWRLVEIRIKENKHTISKTIYGLHWAQAILMEDTWTTF